MKISESWIEKIVIGVQAVLVAVYVWFTFHQEIKQKRRAAQKVQGQSQKERIRYTKAKYRRKRKQLKSPGWKIFT